MLISVTAEYVVLRIYFEQYVHIAQINISIGL